MCSFSVDISCLVSARSHLLILVFRSPIRTDDRSGCHSDSSNAFGVAWERDGTMCGGAVGIIYQCVLAVLTFSDLYTCVLRLR